MSVCGLCKLSVNRQAKDKLVCSVCKLFFHGQCVGGKKISDAELELLVANSWSCKQCMTKLRGQRNDNAESTPAETSSSTSSAQSAIPMDCFKTAILELKHDLGEGQSRLEESLQSCLEKLSSNSETLVRLEEIIKAQQAIILTLRTENTNLKKNVDVLNDRVDSLEQYGRRNTLEIHGIPSAGGENTRDLVLATCKAVGVNLGPEAIDSCHRLPKGANQHSPGIIVKFVRRDDAHMVLDRKKHVRNLSTRAVGVHGEERPIFINLSLTVVRRKILSQVKKLQKNHGFKYVWVDRAGSVKVRPIDKGKVSTINTDKELEAFIAALA
jgi:hypothetical protein